MPGRNGFSGAALRACLLVTTLSWFPLDAHSQGARPPVIMPAGATLAASAIGPGGSATQRFNVDAPEGIEFVSLRPNGVRGAVFDTGTVADGASSWRLDASDCFGSGSGSGSVCTVEVEYVAGDGESRLARLRVVSDSDVGPQTEVMLTGTLGSATDPGVARLVTRDGTVREGESFTAVVERAGGSDGTLETSFDFVNGSAGNDDYALGVSSSSTLTWPDGDTSDRFIMIDALTDGLDEPDEVFRLRVSSDGASFDQSLDVTILDVRLDPGEATFARTASSANEGDTLDVIVNRTGGSDGRLVAFFGNVNRTADESDYAVLPDTGRQLVWENGDTTPRTITVEVFEDTLIDPGETFGVRLASRGDNFDQTHVVTIVDVPPPEPGEARFASTSGSVTEGDTLDIVVNRVGGSDGTLIAFFGDGGGVTADSNDYSILSPSDRQLTWTNGDVSSRTITVQATTDSLPESPETFEILLASEGDNFDQTSAITIIDVPPEPGRATLASTSGSVTEGDTLDIIVNRVGGSDGTLVAFFGDGGGVTADSSDYSILSPSDRQLTWTNGDVSSRTITVQATTDTLPEGPETFEILLASEGDNFDQTSTVTILDSFAPGSAAFEPGFTSVSAPEGSTLLLTVNRADGSDGPLTARVTFDNGTASGDDYRLTFPDDGILTWGDGDDSDRDIDVVVRTDTLIEGDETVSIVLTTDGSGAESRFALTIVDVPPLSFGTATFAADTGSVTEGETLDIVVERTGGRDGTLTATFVAESDTASDADYAVVAPSDGTLRWSDGDDDPRTITVQALTDTLTEPDEQFRLLLSDDRNDGPDRSSTLTIIDVPPALPGEARFTSGTGSLSEGTTLDVVVERVGGTSGTLEREVLGVNGTTDNTDYRILSPASGTLTWADGDDTSRTVVLEALADDLVEPSETVSLVLNEPGTVVVVGDAGSIADSSVITILDVPPTAPRTGTATFADAGGSVTEGDTLDIVVARTGGADGPLETEVFSEDGTAVDDDYEIVDPASGLLNWTDGDVTTRTVTVRALADALAEPDELFTLQLESDGDDGSVQSSPITVVDVPPASTGLATFVEPDESVPEGEILELVVERSGGSAGPLNASVTSLDGSASGTTDYRVIEPSSGTLSWAAGDTGTRTVTVQAFLDGVAEPDETFTLQLTSDGDDGSEQSSAITLVDVTPPSSGDIVFASDTGSLAEGETLEVVVNRVGGTAGVIERDVVGLTDTAGDDDYRIVSPDSGTLAWDDGDDSPRTILVEAFTDALIEPSETFALLLTPPGPTTGGDGSSSFEDTTTITITDVPPAAPETGTATFLDAGGSVTEGDTLDVVVARTGGSDGALNTEVFTENGTASDADYEIVFPSDGQLSWADGDVTDRTVTLQAIGDALVEPDETFTLQLESDGDDGSVQSSTITVIDVPPPEPGEAVFASDAASVAEGDTLDVAVNRVGGSDGELVVLFDAVDGSASDTDYEIVSPASGTLAWADGESDPLVITVRALADDVLEPDEDFALRLSDDGTVFDRSSTITVLDMTEPPPTGTAVFAGTGGAVAEGDALTLQVERSGGTRGALVAAVDVENLTASDTDYRLASPADGQLSWADGDDSPRTVTIEALADALVEPDETLELRLTDDGDSTADARTATVTLLDVIPPASGSATFASAAGSVIEGDTLDVEIARSGGSDGDLVATFVALDGSAGDTDYEIVSPDGGTLAWEDGDTSARTITVRALADALIESDETFELALSDDGDDDSTRSSTITVIDATVPPEPGSATFADAAGSVTEGATLAVVVERTGGSDGALAVDVTDVNGSASDADYRVVAPANGVLSWADGDVSTRTVTVEALADDALEPDETFTLRLGDDGDAGPAPTTTITVVDATVPPETGTATFVATGGSLVEGTTLDVIVERTGGTDGLLVALLSDANSTASDADYTIVSPADGQLSWADGDDSPRTVTVEAFTDDVAEPDETFELQLASDGDDGSVQSSTITVVDVPPPEPGEAVFASDAASVAEGDTLDVVVNRIGGSDGELVVLFDAVDGSASDTDYEIVSPASGTLAWTDGESDPRVITIRALADDVLEPDEDFALRLSNDGEVFDRSSTITVLDMTEPPPTGTAVFAGTGGAVAEGDALTLQVERSGGTRGALVASVDVENLTASDTDYRLASPADGQLSWADGDDGTRTVTIEALADDLVEPDETLELRLTDDGDGDADARVATVTLLDATEPPAPDTVAFAAAETRAGEADGTVELVVRRMGDGTGDASVGYRLEAGTAVPGADYDASGGSGRVSWADGDVSERTVRVPIVADTAIEPEERFSVVLEQADGLRIGEPGTATVVLIDDDVPGELAFDPTRYAVTENDGSVTVSVTRRGGSAGPATVSWQASDDTARAGEDYATGDGATTGGTLSWAADDAGTRTITLPIAADDRLEADERFRVTLSSPAGATLGDADVAIVTIGDSTVPPLDTLAFDVAERAVDEADGDVSLVVRRTGNGAGAASVRYAIAFGDGAEDASPDDLAADAAVAGTLRWGDGETGARAIVLPIADDDVVERDERLVVSLDEARGAEIGSPGALALTLVDDDEPPPVPGTLRFTVDELRVEESAGEIAVGVERTGGTDGELVVELATADDAALAGLDYTAIADTLRWADGEDGVRTVTVPILRDAEVEDDERFVVQLADARAAGEPLALDVDALAVTIVDTTRIGELVLADAELEALESDGELVVRISRTGGSDGPMQIAYETVADTATPAAGRFRRDFESTATPDEDYRDIRGLLRWADGEEGVREARIEIIDDTLDEPNETFRLRFVDPQPVGTPVSGDGVVGITIVDDDDTPVALEDENVEPLASLGSLRIAIVSGDEQSALPDDVLEPMLADVVDGADDDLPVAGVPVRWTVIPAGSAELIDGARTVSDANGRITNRVRVRSRGFLNVVAAIDVEAAPPATGTAPGQARFSVRSGLGQQRRLSDNQRSVGGVLDVFCEILGQQIRGGEDVDAEERDLFTTCTELDARLADDRLGNSLDRLAPEELFAIGDSIIDTTDIQVTNVFTRINTIRAARRGGVDLSGLDLDLYGERVPGSVVDAAGQAWGLGGGGASADGDGPGSRLGVFVNGVVSLGTVDGDGIQRDADVSTAGITVGADYRFTSDIVAGVGLGLVVNDTTFESDGGGVDADGINLTLFATRYTPNASYLDGVIDIGRNGYDVRRRINLPGLPDQFGLGETDADVLSLTVGGGKDFRIRAYELGPYFRLTHTRASVDGYSERAAIEGPGDGSVLDIRAHDIRSTRLAFGGQLSRTVNTRRGVLVPQLRLETEIETEERKDGIEASFRHDPERIPFTVNGNRRDTGGYVNLGLGTSAVFANGKSGYVFYETRAGHEYITQHFLKAGFRLEF